MGAERELAREAGPMPRGASVAVALCAGAWAVLAFSYAYARFGTVHQRTFDLALYARMAWGLVRGDGWDPVVGGSFFGAHVPWVLVPLGLAGELVGTVEALLGGQALAVALATWPLARFAHRRAGVTGALAAVVAWLAYPNLFHVTTYEFHPGTLAVWPLAEALDALDRGRARAVGGWCALAVACRASLALTVLCIGLLALVRAGVLRRVGVWIALGAVGYLALVTLAPPLVGVARGPSLDLHYGVWGGSPVGVFAALVDDPGRVVAHFAAPSRLVYPFVVLAPLALYPLVAPAWLVVALPTVALNLLSAFPTAPALYSHYLTPAVPALVIAALDAASRIARRASGASARTTRILPFAVVAVAALVGSALAGGAPWSRDHTRADYVADALTAERRRVLARIPEGDSVQAPDALLPHLARRRVLHRAPPPERETEYVVLDVSHRQRFAGREDLLRTSEEPLVRRWLARSDHTLVHAEPSLLVLRRRGNPRGGLGGRYLRGAAVRDAAGIALTDCLSLLDARIAGDALTLDLRARDACPPDLALRFGAEKEPRRVDLLFDGLLSPAHLRWGDLARSTHRLSERERAAIARAGLHVGVLRASGAPPRPNDPVSVAVDHAESLAP